MEYACLPQHCFTDGRYQLVPLRYEDIMPIKEWRNEQIEVLRQKEPLTDAMQETYFHNVVLPLFKEAHPRQILFSLLLDGQCIGYGGIVHIDWATKEGEISFLVETRRAKNEALYESDYAVFLQLIKHIASDFLNFHRIFTETYDVRPHHIAIIESSGFHFEKRLRDHVSKNGQVMDSLIHGCIFYE
ncbi:MAG: GNAT family N-acetyltransferase [Parachlamydiaceae bacterium]